jgi:hypothetical protein
MSPSTVSSRFVNPLPGPVVPVDTTFAPTNKSVAFVVFTVPLLLNRLVPVPATNVSTGLAVSRPLYSAILTSGALTDPLNVTVTVLGPATMFFA